MTGGNRKKRKAKRVYFQAPDQPSSNELYEEDDDDNICRCICGDDFTAKRPWIQCTDCEVWQHNDCMDVSVFEDELEDHFRCEECAPERHAELLTAIERWESPWKSSAAQRLNLKQKFESDIKAVLSSWNGFGNSTCRSPKRSLVTIWLFHQIELHLNPMLTQCK